MTQGYGNVFLDVLTIFAVFFAGLCQLAIYMDRTLVETKAVETARMLMFAGYMIIGSRWLFLFLNNENDLPITPVLLIGVLLTAIAQIIVAADRLLYGKRTHDYDEAPAPKA